MATGSHPLGAENLQNISDQLEWQQGQFFCGSEEETLSIELIGTMKHELAIPQTHSAKVANALASRVVVNNWLFHFARNPHATTRTM